MRRFVLTCLSLWLALVITVAQAPEGYYDSAEGLTGTALQQSLHDIIDEHTVIAYSNLYTCFLTTDIKDDNTVWDMYSDIPGGTPAYVYYYGAGQECGNYDDEAVCFNREHSFPKSWFGDVAPMNSDLFHIYPTDGYVNGRRSNYPYGETSSATWTSTNGSKVGPCSVSGYSGVIFEPIDEYKGDFARTYFYMATRYYGEDSNWPGSDMTDGAQPKEWALAMLLEWHRADPVSTKEINRNNEVYSYQNNRNPFIDDPDFVEKIWGNLNPVEEIADNSSSMIIYPNPARDYINISISGAICDGATAYLFDTGGCLVRTEVIDGEKSSVSLGDFPGGIYFIRINCNGKIFTGAFSLTGK